MNYVNLNKISERRFNKYVGRKNLPIKNYEEFLSIADIVSARYNYQLDGSWSTLPSAVTSDRCVEDYAEKMSYIIYAIDDVDEKEQFIKELSEVLLFSAEPTAEKPSKLHAWEY